MAVVSKATQVVLKVVTDKPTFLKWPVTFWSVKLNYLTRLTQCSMFNILVNIIRLYQIYTASVGTYSMMRSLNKLSACLLAKPIKRLSLVLAQQSGNHSKEVNKRLIRLCKSLAGQRSGSQNRLAENITRYHKS